MHNLLETQSSSIKQLKLSIATTIANKYSIDFDIDDKVHIDILIALYEYWVIKNKRISRTLQAIRNNGLIEAVDMLVSRDHDSFGFLTFLENDMLEKTFEHVVLCNPSYFSTEARLQAIKRFI